ncbi:MAG: aldo/keto reductase [Chloroflexota bacterium]
MDPLARRSLGRTSVQVTCLGFGGATLGDIRAQIDESRAATTIEVAYGAGIGYFDTAPWYGTGKSERRFGNVLGLKPRDSFVLSTKIGRVLVRPHDLPNFKQERWTYGLPFEVKFDYTRDGVLRSYEDSLTRMGLNRIDALLIHDLDLGHHLTDEGVTARLDELDSGGGYQALLDLKQQGHIGAIGAGINVTGMIPRFLERFDLDFFLVAMPYTLLSQEALDSELPLCESRGASIVIGAAFASGILAIGPVPGATYRYQPAPPEIMEKAGRIQAVCERHGVPLGAAALQFLFGHPAVSAAIPGPNAPDQVKTNLEWMRTEIPADLWAELKSEGLIRADAPTPTA